MKKIILLLSIFVSSQLCAEWVIDATHLNPGDDDNCPAGGTLLTFSDTEQSAEWNAGLPKAYVCNGEDGCEVLTVPLQISNTRPECQGRQAWPIKSGLDCDGNSEMDPGTETITSVCFGKTGNPGNLPATDVEDADDGEDGSDGANGKTSELVLTVEEAGENCSSGGTKIENRFDANGNNTFEASEISVSYVCKGEPGLTPEGPKGSDGLAESDGKDGSKGPKGDQGDRGDKGTPGEQGEPGADGADGRDMLMSVADEAAGDNCKNGGKKFMSGVDADGNGVLDEAEIKSSYYICNGENAVEASETVKESGCSATSVDTDTVSSIRSIISHVCDFVSNLF